jgi:hypothetical protein
LFGFDTFYFLSSCYVISYSSINFLEKGTQTTIGTNNNTVIGTKTEKDDNTNNKENDIQQLPVKHHQLLPPPSDTKTQHQDIDVDNEVAIKVAIKKDEDDCDDTKKDHDDVRDDDAADAAVDCDDKNENRHKRQLPKIIFLIVMMRMMA